MGLATGLPLGIGLGKDDLGIEDDLSGGTLGGARGSRPTEPDAVALTPCFADAAAPLASAADSGDVSLSLLRSFIGSLMKGGAIICNNKGV